MYGSPLIVYFVLQLSLCVKTTSVYARLVLREKLQKKRKKSAWKTDKNSTCYGSCESVWCACDLTVRQTGFCFQTQSDVESEKWKLRETCVIIEQIYCVLLSCVFFVFFIFPGAGGNSGKSMVFSFRFFLRTVLETKWKLVRCVWCIYRKTSREITKCCTRGKCGSLEPVGKYNLCSAWYEKGVQTHKHTCIPHGKCSGLWFRFKIEHLLVCVVCAGVCIGYSWGKKWSVYQCVRRVAHSYAATVCEQVPTQFCKLQCVVRVRR